jgi:exopolyphosphatase / guanosine-5'-triphosphate,3'-diphosphate pyrophosphatase
MIHTLKRLREASSEDEERTFDASSTIAVIDMGASSIRLVIAEVRDGSHARILEEASRGVLLGKDTFSHGKLAAATVESTVKVIEGFRRLMEGYGVGRYRAVATSAVREASNRDSVLDRIRLRTGIEVEIIDGSEENRLTYLAVRETLHGSAAGREGSLLVEVGGGSADISFLQNGEPVTSGTYPLGSIRMRQSLASWRGSHEQKMKLLRRHIQNVTEDVRREMPVETAGHFLALGGDVRFAADRVLGEDGSPGRIRSIERGAFESFCDVVVGQDIEQLVESYGLPMAGAETLVPALMAYRELLRLTLAQEVLVPGASLRGGLLLELEGGEAGEGIEELRRQVLASASALGEKYRYDARHGRNVAKLTVMLFDQLRAEHGLSARSRLLLEVAALLHDVGVYVGRRAHHKHSLYILSVSEIFGLSRDEMAIVANVARYHRRATPQKSHLPYMALDRQTRVPVLKVAAILRVANALDAEHLQKVEHLRLHLSDDAWTLEVEGAGDVTMERLAFLSRSDLFTETFGRKVGFRQSGEGP